MANRRLISKSISTSSKLSEVPMLARLLFTWLIPHCDDSGNMDAQPKIVKAIVLPLTDDTVEDIAKAIEALKEVGLITLYKAKNGSNSEDIFLHINKWEQHQTIRWDRLNVRYPTYGQPSVNRSATYGRPNITKSNINKSNITKSKAEKAAREYLKKWNEVFGTNFESIRALVGNMECWLEEYTLEQILKAVAVIPQHHFWKDKMVPETFLRQKNPRQEAVNYIGEMLNYKPRAAPTRSFR